ncbi:MAG: hypothetical protein M3Z03_16575 [Actinomycetota bacterium]|nr:hypothetical protein [Actinomycetota bacterium]
MTERSSPRALPPWRLSEMLVLYGFTVASVVVMLVGWWGVSGTARLSHQVPWICVAVGGLILLGTGNSFWLLIGRRAVADRRRELLAAFAPFAADTGTATEVHLRNGAAPKPVAATGMGHYHRPTCQLVQGKATRAATVAAHAKAGRRPCGMCEP